MNDADLRTAIRDFVSTSPPPPVIDTPDELVVRRQRAVVRRPPGLWVAGLAVAAALIVGLVVVNGRRGEDEAQGEPSWAGGLPGYVWPSELPDGWKLIDVSLSVSAPTELLPPAQLFRRTADGAGIMLVFDGPLDAPSQRPEVPAATEAPDTVSANDDPPATTEVSAARAEDEAPSTTAPGVNVPSDSVLAQGAALDEMVRQMNEAPRARQAVVLDQATDHFEEGDHIVSVVSAGLSVDDATAFVHSLTIDGPVYALPPNSGFVLEHERRAVEPSTAAATGTLTYLLPSGRRVMVTTNLSTDGIGPFAVGVPRELGDSTLFSGAPWFPAGSRLWADGLVASVVPGLEPLPDGGWTGNALTATEEQQTTNLIESLRRGGLDTWAAAKQQLTRDDLRVAVHSSFDVSGITVTTREGAVPPAVCFQRGSDMACSNARGPDWPAVKFGGQVIQLATVSHEDMRAPLTVTSTDGSGVVDWGYTADGPGGQYLVVAVQAEPGFGSFDVRDAGGTVMYSYPFTIPLL